MTLVLTEEQELLQKTARDFVREKSPVKAFRSLRDRNEADGFDRKLGSFWSIRETPPM
jgi:hypothetical protein